MNSIHLEKADEIVEMLRFFDDRRPDYVLKVAPDKTCIIPG